MTVGVASQPLPPLRDPADNGGLFEVFKQRWLLTLLVRRELSARYMGSVFGFAWSYIQPALRFLMYFFLVGMLVRKGAVENFGIHLFCGMVLVNYFTSTFTSGTQSILSNRSLAQKLSLPLEMFPVAAMLVSLYHVIPQSIILIVACLAVGWSPDLVSLAALVLGFAIVAFLGTAVGLLFSALNVYFQDFGKFVATLVTMAHFSVPMMYTYGQIFERFGSYNVFGVNGAQLFLYNPLASAVLLWQRCFWSPTTSQPAQTAITDFPPNLFALGIGQLVFSVAFLYFAQRMFTRLEKRIPERLS